MIVLGIDVCLGRCSVALLFDGAVVATASEEMARGHVERLAPMVSDILDDAGVAASELDLIGVTCGPGGFTGARLGVAFARGLALASGARAAGVSTLEAIAAPFAPEAVTVAIDGRKGDLFVQTFEGGAAVSEPEAIAVDALSDHAGAGRIVGPDPLSPIDAAMVARLAMRDDAPSPPRPLYLRAPDAKPAARPVLR